MELSMLSRKRPFFNGSEEEPPPYTKKGRVALRTLLDRHPTDRLDGVRLKTSCGHSCAPEACLNGGTKHPTDTEVFFERLSSWADTEYSVNKVLEHLKFRPTEDDDGLLGDSVNKKFVEFHRDFTEECGAEDKQHSWAVIEKREEIVMYGPFYPNYNSGEHSEDIIIRQTQELLESDAVSEDWKVYVFTMNSPCLARNTDPCMLNLVRKAHEWWSVYGVKTHIGYVKCWGFKGTKENLFRDINYSQVGRIDQAEEHESYVKAAENPLCENLFSAVKHLLRSVSFPPKSFEQGQDWKGCFKSMYDISPEDEKDIVAREVDAVVEAAQALLSEEGGSFEGFLDKGQAFVSGYTFSSHVSDGIRDQMRLTFRQCWREMAQDKYTEFIRERLTEDFNQCTVQLFIKDVVNHTKQYLQIGKIQLLEDSGAPQVHP